MKKKTDYQKVSGITAMRDKQARMTKSQPLVSVVMPVYNAGDFLVEAVTSILTQTYTNFELIIVDDASTDNSWNIISKFQKKYPHKIKAIHLKHNLNRGGDACANVGIAKARGTYIARMDADDIAHPERLTKQVAYMEQHPEILVLGTQAHVINKEGKTIGIKSVPTTHAEIYKSYAVFHPLIHPTVMLRKSMLPKRAEFYKIKYSANNDLYTFFELLHKGTFANMEEKLLYYRMHGHNDSLTKPKERFFNTLKIRLQAIQHFGYKPTLKSIMINTVQTVAIVVLPERLIVPVYLYMKGIAKKPVLFELVENLPFVKETSHFARSIKLPAFSLSKSIKYITNIFI